MNLDELKKKIAELDEVKLPEPPSDAHIQAMKLQTVLRRAHLPEAFIRRVYEDMKRGTLVPDREDDLEL